MLITKHSIPVIHGIINRFGTWQIEDIAENVGFKKRNDNKLSPVTLVKAMTLGIYNIPNPTLELIAEACEDLQEDLKISREAIFQRMPGGSKLMKGVFKLALEYLVNKSLKSPTIDVLRQFNNVYICDSTVVTLTEKLKKYYHSARNSGNKGAVKIQLMLNLISKTVKSMEVFTGNINDQSYMKEISKVLKAEELAVFDLGYNDKGAYKEIIDNGAFFITRTMSNCAYYEENHKGVHKVKKLRILDILQKSNGLVDRELFIGDIAPKRIRCRLVAIKLPENIANERIRKAREASKGKTLSDSKLEQLRWNMFITNAPKERLTAESICDIYRARWQVEIFFKACKSHLGLNDLGKGGKDETDCILYGRLIMIAFMSTLYSELNSAVFLTLKREVSLLKLFSKLKVKSNEFIEALKYRINLNKLISLLNKVVNRSLIEVRKRKSTMANLLMHELPALAKTG